MSFKATEAVPALDYDFTPHVEAKGTVPEPSQKAIKKFNKAMRQLTGGKSLLDIAKLDEDEQEAMNDGMKPIIADLCQGHPSLAQLDELPHRLLSAFCGWLMGQLQNPS